MKQKHFIAVLLLMLAGVQTVWAQGFRVYNSDGTILQFSLRTDSIVFYGGIGSDQNLGLYTPVNQCIAGEWRKKWGGSVVFRENGTTNYFDDEEKPYEYFPFQGNVIVYDNEEREECRVLNVYKLTKDTLIMGRSDDYKPDIYVRRQQPTPSLHLCPDDNHPHAIDLGLPSGTKWACCNVGAGTPEDYGCYFAWGETSEKNVFNENNYNQFEEELGNDIVGTIYDAARMNMGEPWQMPTREQLEELIGYPKVDANRDIRWTELNDMLGILVTGPNGNQIFLPAAGYGWDGYTQEDHEYQGRYWSGVSNRGGDYADPLRFYQSYDSESVELDWSNETPRYNGYSVRAVCK